MLTEGRLSCFYSPPKFDLKLNFDQEKKEEEEEVMRPWPDTESLFGDDPDYQGLVTDLMTYIGSGMERVEDFLEVSRLRKD